MRKRVCVMGHSCAAEMDTRLYITYNKKKKNLKKLASVRKRVHGAVTVSKRPCVLDQLSVPSNHNRSPCDSVLSLVGSASNCTCPEKVSLGQHGVSSAL